MQIFWQLLAAVATGWLIAMGSVALGGFLVYRTKREDGTVFMPKQEDHSEAFNLGEEDYAMFDTETEEEPDILSAKNERFAEQMAQQLAERAMRSANV